MYASPLTENVLSSSDLAERVALGLARRLKLGRLSLHLPDARSAVFSGAQPGPQAEMRVRHPRVFRRLLSGGLLGLAEAYLEGDWDSADLTSLIALGAVNEDILGPVLTGNRFTRLTSRVIHSLRPNSKRGARRNIAAHYDLGNAFYSAWLDRTMTYSSALFEQSGETLEEAQARKYRRLAELAGIAPGHHVLEIGCGWGGFSLWAARNIGCRITALTISQEQFDHARRAVHTAGLDHLVEIRLQDYRDVSGSFDAIVSIEMLEAVGEAYWPLYFARLRELLRPGGRAALQVITIADDRFEEYRRSVDFIQRYIFPGGMLPSPTKLSELASGAGLSIRQEARHGEDYERTLALWRERFERAWPGISSRSGQGQFDARFRRLWRFYLAYCEAGFRTGRIDLQLLALQHS
jgi:cyclopropane-fatty-acyl-phospholipid synthase